MPPRTTSPRNKQVIFLVSEQEKKWLHRQARSVGLDLSDYLRARAGLKIRAAAPFDGAATYAQAAGPEAKRIVGEALAGLQAGIDNARALLEGGGEEER